MTGIDWKQWTTKAVLAFIVALALTLAFCEDSEAAGKRTSISIAPESLWVGGDKVSGSVLQVRQDFGNRFECSLGVVTQIASSMPNAKLGCQRIVGDWPVTLGIGAAWWKNQSVAWDSNFTFTLGLRYTYDDKYFVGYDHDSTAGSSAHNSGIDLIYIGMWFGGK